MTWQQVGVLYYKLNVSRVILLAISVQSILTPRVPYVDTVDMRFILSTEADFSKWGLIFARNPYPAAFLRTDNYVTMPSRITHQQ